MKALQDADIDEDIVQKCGGAYKIQCFVNF